MSIIQPVCSKPHQQDTTPKTINITQQQLSVRLRDLATGIASEFDALVDGALLLESIGYETAFNESPKGEGAFLFYYPISLGNPFQALYYSEALNNGIVTIGTNDLKKITRLRWIGKTCLHLHWLGGIIGEAENEKVARERMVRFIDDLALMKKNGVKIMWTVHNVLPHDSILQPLQIELRMELIKLCDVIHVMNEETVEIADAFYRIPDEKILNTPHPTYEGYYPNITSRPEARYYLDISTQEFVFLFFGSIQAYKGLEDLVRAFKLLDSQTERKMRLLIAGKVANPSHFRTIVDEINEQPNITLIQSRVPIEDVQYFFAAADCCVCPYRISLNSGVAHLSHTFGVPVIGPNVGGFKALLSEGGGLLYEEMNQESLVESMRAGLDMDRDELQKQIQSLNADHNPSNISNLFFKKFPDILGWRTD